MSVRFMPVSQSLIQAKFAPLRDFGLFINRALAARPAATAARPNTQALLGPLPAAVQLLRSTNRPSLYRAALCANCQLFRKKIRINVAVP